MADLASRITDLAAAVRDKFNAISTRLVAAGGTTGHVYTKTSDGHEWSAATGGSSGGGGLTNTIALSGSFITGMILGSGGLTSSAAAIDGWRMYPWTPNVDITIDRLGLHVTSGVATGVAKITVHEANSFGLPGTLLKETGSLDCASSGYKFESWSYTFTKGTTYWLGVRTGVVQFNVAGLIAGYGPAIGHSNTNVAPATYISKPTAFATAATSNPSISTSDLNNASTLVLAWMRVA